MKLYHSNATGAVPKCHMECASKWPANGGKSPNSSPINAPAIPTRAPGEGMGRKVEGGVCRCRFEDMATTQTTYVIYDLTVKVRC